MVEFSYYVLRVFIMTINNKSERNYRGKCLGWPVTSYGGDLDEYLSENDVKSRFRFGRDSINYLAICCPMI